MFILAKLLRFAFFVTLIVFLMENTQSLAGYSSDQILLFFLTYTLIDSLSQMLFREVYRFRAKVVSGDFDMDLVKPIASLFRPLLGGADPFDMITLVPFTIVFTVVAIRFAPTAEQVVWFLVLILNAVLIAASFHILVLALGVFTTQIDHAIMIYRDIIGMGRFPPEVYPVVIRTVLLTLVPIALMVTIPARILMGVFSWEAVAMALAISGLFLLFSWTAWRRALSLYSSASS